MEPLAENKGVALFAPILNEAVMVTGDRGWLERVILNLLDNAIKFTPQGGHVKITVGSETGEAFFEVKDDGIGITSDALPHIFERFYRGDPSRSRQTEGTGLGLSLVEWIVRHHQGRITVKSEANEGAAFRVALPMPDASRPL